MDDKALQAVDDGCQSPGVGSPPFDLAKYMEHVEDFDMSEAQKIEFLRVLWEIMASFVRLGFDVDSVIPALTQNASENGANGLEEVIPTHEFNLAVEDGGTRKDDQE